MNKFSVIFLAFILCGCGSSDVEKCVSSHMAAYDAREKNTLNLLWEHRNDIPENKCEPCECECHSDEDVRTSREDEEAYWHLKCLAAKNKKD